MNQDPKILKQLAEKTKNSPEWTGANGVFVSPETGYMGVKLFSEYSRDLRRKNGGLNVPDVLPRLAYDYVDYLAARQPKPEEQLYYDKKIPHLRNLIHEGRMTHEEIVDFAKIFVELGIGENPLMAVADYQTAVSESFKVKISDIASSGNLTENAKTQIQNNLTKNTGATVKATSNSTKSSSSYSYGGGYSEGSGWPTSSQNPASSPESTKYQQLILTDYEKNLIIESSIADAQKENPNMTAEEIAAMRENLNKQLDNIYVDSKGYLYNNDGTALTDSKIGNPLSMTLRYKIAIGEATLLHLSDQEVEDLVKKLKAQGVSTDEASLRKELQNLYVDKNGQIFNADGKRNAYADEIKKLKSYKQKAAELIEKAGLLNQGNSGTDLNSGLSAAGGSSPRNRGNFGGGNYAKNPLGQSGLANMGAGNGNAGKTEGSNFGIPDLHQNKAPLFPRQTGWSIGNGRRMKKKHSKKNSQQAQDNPQQNQQGQKQEQQPETRGGLNGGMNGGQGTQSPQRPKKSKTALVAGCAVGGGFAGFGILDVAYGATLVAHTHFMVTTILHIIFN